MAVKRQGAIQTDDAIEPKSSKSTRKRESTPPGRRKECIVSTYEIWMGRIFRIRGNFFGQET